MDVKARRKLIDDALERLQGNLHAMAEEFPD
jgi:hypothetical protein